MTRNKTLISGNGRTVEEAKNNYEEAFRTGKSNNGRQSVTLVEDAAKEREAEMRPTPEVHEAFDAMQDRTDNPVASDGTTEAKPVVNDPMRQRYEAAEAQKEKDLKEYVKQSDGRPKI